MQGVVRFSFSHVKYVYRRKHFKVNRTLLFIFLQTVTQSQ